MPTYQYRCTECGNELEAVQRFSDPSLTECPSCEGQLRKVFNAVGVVFKGSGFYRTDSRTDAKKSAGSTSADGGSTSGDKGTGEKTSTDKKSGDSTSTEKSASKQPVAAGSSSSSAGGS
jgi:putative FmdB family regulatory protein